MYNYICFDLDGTLTMSEFGVTRSVEYALNKMGIEEPDKAKLLRFIGDPWQRIKEDPLRIIRAERFAKRLGFNFESDTRKAIDELQGELSSLNPEKVLMERKKV